RRIHPATVPGPPLREFRLEDGLVDRDLVEDLLPKGGLVALADALQVAEGTVETHAAVNHPCASVGERHQVDLKDAVAFVAFPGERPSRWTRLVAHPAAPAQLLLVDLCQLALDQSIEGDEELEDDLAVVVDPALEVEIRFSDWHLGHDTFSPGFP